MLYEERVLTLRRHMEDGVCLDRIATIQHHMIQSWEVPATLTPHDFLTLRGDLRKASGFRSFQYRGLEIA